MTKDEALKLALEALESKYVVNCGAWRVQQDQAITAIREALAQPKQEPVPWATIEDFYREIDRSVERVRKEMQIKSVTMRGKDYDLALPIIDAHFGHVFVGQVPTPPQRKPLTDEEIILIVADCASSHQHTDIHFARAIEAAHGIKGEA